MGAIPVYAHHSFGAEFDGSKPITLTGVVTKIEWTKDQINYDVVLDFAREFSPFKAAKGDR